MRDFLRRARGWLTGLNAVSARFDLLQNRTDALMGASERTNAALAELAAALPGVVTQCGSPSKDWILEVNGGGLALGDLPEGEWRLLGEGERRALFAPA